MMMVIFIAFFSLMAWPVILRHDNDQNGFSFCGMIRFLATGMILAITVSGWWLGHPSEKYEFVNWDD